MSKYIDADKLCDGCVSNDPVVIAAKCAPEEDVAPVVHAHWIAKEILVKTITAKNYICSVCGNENYHYPYCPYCGAKMDGKENKK